MKETTINPELENVVEKLREVRGKRNKIPEVILDFVDYVADIAEKKCINKAIAETIVLLIDEAKKSIEYADSGLKIEFQPPLTLICTERLIKEKLFYWILVIDEIASEEFSKKFRELFIVFFS